MTDAAEKTYCVQPELNARRITLKDGRYLIFFEFDDRHVQEPADAADKESVDMDV